METDHVDHLIYRALDEVGVVGDPRFTVENTENGRVFGVEFKSKSGALVEAKLPEGASYSTIKAAIAAAFAA